MTEVWEKKERGEESWCVLISAENLFIVGPFRERGVAVLKLIVPQGARRFYRKVDAHFFAPFELATNQVEWLVEAGLFKGAWEVLSDYRRTLVEALAVEYKEVWLVEAGQARRLELDLLPSNPSLAEKYGLGPLVTVKLGWARSFAVYCHRHRVFELKPCKGAGILAELPIPPASKRKRGDIVLKAPANTLIRANRQQSSYYLAQEDDFGRLGRDEAGELAAQEVIQSQRLALTIRAARTLTLAPKGKDQATFS